MPLLYSMLDFTSVYCVRPLLGNKQQRSRNTCPYYQDANETIDSWLHHLMLDSYRCCLLTKSAVWPTALCTILIGFNRCRLKVPQWTSVFCETISAHSMNLTSVCHLAIVATSSSHFWHSV